MRPGVGYPLQSPALAACLTYIDQTIISIAVPQTIFPVMAGIMAAAALVALAGLRAGQQQDPGELRAAPEIATSDELAGSPMASVTVP
jgi:hypothetical protein